MCRFCVNVSFKLLCVNTKKCDHQVIQQKVFTFLRNCQAVSIQLYHLNSFLYFFYITFLKSKFQLGKPDGLPWLPPSLQIVCLVCSVTSHLNTQFLLRNFLYFLNDYFSMVSALYFQNVHYISIFEFLGSSSLSILFSSRLMRQVLKVVFPDLIFNLKANFLLCMD